MTATPTIYPPSGAYTGTQYVGMTTVDGSVRFTTDGTDPTGSSELFTRGFKVTDGLVVKAISDLEGVLSSVVTAVYGLSRAIPTPIPSYQAAVLPMILEQYKGDNP